MEQEKKLKTSLIKAVDPERKSVEGYVSTVAWDRDGERFVKGAWDLSSFMKNPVVLWAHDNSQPPIAKAAQITEDDLGLKAMTQFDIGSPRSLEYFRLFQAGFLNAFSVGFMRMDYQVEDMMDGSGERGIAITKAELFEYSAVPVPAQPGALVSREVAELAMKAVGPDSIERFTTKSFGEQFLAGTGIVKLEAKPDPEIEKNAASSELEESLKRVIELAKIAKGSNIGESKRSLILTASAVFNEMLEDSHGEIGPEEMKKLGEALAGFAGVVSSIYPEIKTVVEKTISQIDKAISGRAA